MIIGIAIMPRPQRKEGYRKFMNCKSKKAIAN
jgi:hypothetical protein